MPKVYVVNEPLRKDDATGAVKPAVDVSPAEDFGTLVFLLAPGRVPRDPVALIDLLRAGLLHFTKDDFLLPVGDLVACCIATALVARERPFNLLRWDAVRRRYSATEFYL